MRSLAPSDSAWHAAAAIRAFFHEKNIGKVFDGSFDFFEWVSKPDLTVEMSPRDHWPSSLEFIVIVEHFKSKQKNKSRELKV